MATIYTRYGKCFNITDINSEWITSKLIIELRDESSFEQNDEHSEVSVSNEHWGISAKVSGLITFDNFDILEGMNSDYPETMFTRDLPDSNLIDIWQSTIRMDYAGIMKYEWHNSITLPPYKRDFYRKL